MLALKILGSCAKITQGIFRPRYMPIVLIGLLIALNTGFYTFLSPNLIREAVGKLPYWDLLERPDLEWITVSGQPKLEQGIWVANQKTQAQMPLMLLPNQAYRVKIPIRLEPNGVVEIWFNVQQKHRLQSSHLLKLESKHQRFYLTAWVYNRLGELRILESAEVAAQNAVLELQVNTRYFRVWFAQQWLFTAPLSYLGGILGVGLERASLEEVLVVTDPTPIPSNQPWQLVSPIWQALGGTWRIQNGVLEQIDPRDFDQLLVWQKPLTALRSIEVELSGFGAGVVFAMPKANTSQGGYMVRFSEDGKNLFWGRFGQQGFIGKGNRSINAKAIQKLRLEFRQNQFDLYLNQQRIAQNIIIRQKHGFMALTSSLSSARFLQLRVNQQAIGWSK